MKIRKGIMFLSLLAIFNISTADNLNQSQKNINLKVKPCKIQSKEFKDFLKSKNIKLLQTSCINNSLKEVIIQDNKGDVFPLYLTPDERFLVAGSVIDVKTNSTLIQERLPQLLSNKEILSGLMKNVGVLDKDLKPDIVWGNTKSSIVLTLFVSPMCPYSKAEHIALVNSNIPKIAKIQYVLVTKSNQPQENNLIRAVLCSNKNKLSTFEMALSTIGLPSTDAQIDSQREFIRKNLIDLNLKGQCKNIDVSKRTIEYSKKYKISQVPTIFLNGLKIAEGYIDIGQLEKMIKNLQANTTDNNTKKQKEDKGSKK